MAEISLSDEDVHVLMRELKEAENSVLNCLPFDKDRLIEIERAFKALFDATAPSQDDPVYAQLRGRVLQEAYACRVKALSRQSERYGALRAYCDALEGVA